MGEQQHSHTEVTGARLRLLQQELTAPRSRPADAPPTRTRPAHPAPPVDIDTLDYLQRSAQEVIDHTRAAAPDAGPAPAELSHRYAWMEEATAHLGAEQQRVRDAIVVRQGLEHALRAGDDSVIRRIACPACGCWGLFWRAAQERAACINRNCGGSQGVSLWTLGQLAERQVEKTFNRAAT